MADRLVKITHDVFDIADRLKEIDGGYYPVYNLNKKRYEVHHENGKDSLQVVLPYDTLDARAIEKVRSTRSEWVEKLLREMDRQNEILRAQKEREKQERLRSLIDCAMG